MMAVSTPLRSNKRVCDRPTPVAISRSKHTVGTRIDKAAQNLASPPRIRLSKLQEEDLSVQVFFPEKADSVLGDSADQVLRSGIPPIDGAIFNKPDTPSRSPSKSGVGSGSDVVQAAPSAEDSTVIDDESFDSPIEPDESRAEEQAPKNPRPPQPENDPLAFKEGNHWCDQGWLKKAFPFHKKCGKGHVPESYLAPVDLMARCESVRRWRCLSPGDQQRKKLQIAAEKKAEKAAAKAAKAAALREERLRKKREKQARCEQKRKEKVARRRARREVQRAATQTATEEPHLLNEDEAEDVAAAMLSFSRGDADAGNTGDGTGDDRDAERLHAGRNGRRGIVRRRGHRREHVRRREGGYVGALDTQAWRNETVGETASAKTAKSHTRRKTGEVPVRESQLVDRSVIRSHFSLFTQFFKFSKQAEKPERGADGESTEAWADMVPVLFLVNRHKRNPTDGGYICKGTAQRLDHDEVVVLCLEEGNIGVVEKALCDRAERASGSEEESPFQFRIFTSLKSALAIDGARKQALRVVESPEEVQERTDEFGYEMVDEEEDII